MNPCLTLTHNNLALTKRCVESIRQQDIQTSIHIIDNGSTDGTLLWLTNQPDIRFLHNDTNEGVSAGWNEGLRVLFEHYEAEHVLVCGNDTWLPASFYGTLLSLKLPFVTGIAVDNMEQAKEAALIMPLEPRPDFSAYCISRECWKRVGPFDERMKHYCSDQDYHLRAHRKGITLLKASVPYYHERSSTLRLASPEERHEIESQANKDRATLKDKWGVSAGGKDYEALFSPENFGVNSKQDFHESRLCVVVAKSDNRESV